MNYRRKCTEGWSVHMVLLDMSGGVLALAQMFLDAINYGARVRACVRDLVSSKYMYSALQMFVCSCVCV